MRLLSTSPVVSHSNGTCFRKDGWKDWEASVALLHGGLYGLDIVSERNVSAESFLLNTGYCGLGGCGTKCLSVGAAWHLRRL
jgi:hypothetical protein